MKKSCLSFVLAALVFLLGSCGGGGSTANGSTVSEQESSNAEQPADGRTVDENAANEHTIRVGVVGAFSSHWNLISEMVADQGINIEIVSFSDYFTPNMALSDGELDLNAFQHHAFLANEIAANGYEIEYIAETFVGQLNLFHNKSRISSLEDLQDGHTIGIPGDQVNGDRALRVLESAGLIVLDAPEGGIVSRLDIAEYVVDINIVEAESGMLAGMLPDMEAAVINGDNAFTAGLNPDYDSIFRENVAQERFKQYTNLVVARSEDVRENGERMRVFRTIVDAFHSDEVRQFILEEYGGVYIPVW